jgi:hypothetical protein|tara:strand:- start:517 stop:816 length:300 start_codon:yes stop_codon:yes gene_type:complete
MSVPSLNLDITPTFKVDVKTTENRGFTPEEVAERCADKVISISDTANPIIRDQARAFKTHLIKVLSFYMKEAIKSDRTTVYNALSNAGHKDLAELIRRM